MIPGRRRLLLGGVATTGAAYVAPQVLHMAVAGAQAATVHVFKLDNTGCNTSGLAAGPTDADCDAAFNAALSGSVVGQGTLTIGCPPAGVATPNLGVTSGEVVVGPNCTVLFAGVLTNQGTCYASGQAGGEVLIEPDEKSACYVLAGGETFASITLAVRCVGSL